jgi:hypothetical protein
MTNPARRDFGPMLAPTAFAYRCIEPFCQTPRSMQDQRMKQAFSILGSVLLASCAHTASVQAESIDAIFARDATLRSVCDRADIDGFKYYFFNHADMRHAVVAGTVRVIRPDSAPRNVQRDRYSLEEIPIFGVHQGVETVTERPAFQADTPDGAWLKVDVEPLPDGAFQIVWVRAQYEVTGAMAMPGRLLRTHGPTGRLTFRRTAQCWELVEDAITDPV